jgi:hypothetical protein
MQTSLPSLPNGIPASEPGSWPDGDWQKACNNEETKGEKGLGREIGRLHKTQMDRKEGQTETQAEIIYPDQGSKKSMVFPSYKR